jgi:hypothetical protein
MENQINDGVKVIIGYLEETIAYIKKIHTDPTKVSQKEHPETIAKFLIVAQTLLSTFVSMTGRPLPEKIKSIESILDGVLRNCILSIQELELKMAELEQWGELANRYPIGHA